MEPELLAMELMLDQLTKNHAQLMEQLEKVQALVDKLEKEITDYGSESKRPGR